MRMLLFNIYGVLSLTWVVASLLRLGQWFFGIEWVEPSILGDLQAWSGWPALAYAIIFNRDMNQIFKTR